MENIADGDRLTVPMRFIATEDTPAWFPNETFPKEAKPSNTSTGATTTNIGGKNAPVGPDGRIQGIVEVGPVWKLGDLMAVKWKPGDPPNRHKERLINPTPAELHKYGMDKMDKHVGETEGERRKREGSGKPMFGPERPTEKK